MTKRNQHFEMHAGETVDLNVVVTDKATKVRKNLAGATIKWVLYDEATEAAVLTKTTATPGDITDIDGLNGLFTVALAPADTANVAPGTYYHESEVIDSGGAVSVVLTGQVKIFANRAGS